MQDRTLKEKTDFSDGYDAGNYGNAYDSQNFDAWVRKHKIANRSDAYLHGAMLGFFSSYELAEIGSDYRDVIEELRDAYAEEI